ncbi:MAG TPA: DUF4340 domain-containing protein [Methylomirabilota bacterium]|nr:DUF4340 domain-containing protein [Methylomirabilota bacterium]
MNSKTTGIWFVVAAALGIFIFAFEHYFHFAASAQAGILPRLQPDAVTGVQVIPSGAPEICVARTNGNWFLSKPLFYPGQSAAIEALLDALQKLVPAPRISAAEMRENKNADAEFGFLNPQIRLNIEAGEQRWQLDVGNKTAPGNQVYLRVVGVDGAFVADAGWLNLVPRSANDWRDTSLVDARQNNFDYIMLTNGVKGLAIELRRDATNHLWRMLQPLQARADTEHINDALQQLQMARVTQFVTDDSKADLVTYGLNPAELDLWLGNMTNRIVGLKVGQSVANDATQVYAKREGWNAIFKTAKEPLATWSETVNKFRDSRLLELTAPVAEIQMRRGGSNNFILRRQGSNDWSIVGEKFPADAESVQTFIKELADLRVAEFVKDVVTPANWPDYGLDAPQEEITLRSIAGDTNAPLVQLNFGTNQNNDVFVRRSDEDFIYAVTWQDFHHLPESAWQLRDRHIWNFNPDDIVQITIRQNGKTRQLIHGGGDKWSLASGSQGIVVGGSIEQAVQRLSQLTSVGWLGCNLPDSENLGFKPDNLQITTELKDGKKLTVDFGAPTVNFGINDSGVLAAVTLEGDRWTFEFPPVAYQFVLSYLTIPANVP